MGGNRLEINSFRSGSNGSMSKRSFNCHSTARGPKNGIGMMNPIDTFEAKSKSISIKQKRVDQDQASVISEAINSIRSNCATGLLKKSGSGIIYPGGKTIQVGRSNFQEYYD